MEVKREEDPENNFLQIRKIANKKTILYLMSVPLVLEKLLVVFINFIK